MREAVAEEERAHVEDENDFAMPVSESTPAVTRERRRGRRLRSHHSHRAARVRGGWRREAHLWHLCECTTAESVQTNLRVLG